MTEVPTRELRNDTAGVIRRVERGEDVTITVKGRPVARLVPLSPSTRRPVARAELVRRLSSARADPLLRDELRALDTSTDELDD